jgi:hypothetical protein
VGVKLLEGQTISALNIAIGVISMRISEAIFSSNVTWNSVQEYNRANGWVVQFPEQDESTCRFIRRKVVLNDDNLAIAWETAQRLKSEYVKQMCEEE